ncbi:MAG: endonuclease/exonuclease/phosphatase family protein, partial [Roseimicrobium sp.]
SFSKLLAAGFVDTFRHFEPGAHHYSWWSYRGGARERNVGWRLDYWLTSEALRGNLHASRIRPEVWGSDHCPVELELGL